MCFAPQPRALFRHLNFQKCSEHGVLCTFDLETRFAPQRRALLRHLNFQKCSEHGVLCTFDLEMCFAPQRRVLFRHLNFQKCSEHGVLCTFWLGNVLRATTACTFFDVATSKLCTCWFGNVLRATTACNFSSLIWPDGSAPAALASLLFDPPEPQIIGKQWIVFYLFAHLHLLSPDSFSSLILFLLLFSSLTLTTSAFPSVHIVGNLTSKLFSITTSYSTSCESTWSRPEQSWSAASLLFSAFPAGFKRQVSRAQISRTLWLGSC